MVSLDFIKVYIYYISAEKIKLNPMSHCVNSADTAATVAQ